MEGIGEIIGRLLGRVFSDAPALAGGCISKSSEVEKVPATGAAGEFVDMEGLADAADFTASGLPAGAGDN